MGDNNKGLSRLFFLLAILSLIVLVGCSGGGGGSSEPAQPVQKENVTADTVTKVIGSSGGEISLNEFTMTFPEGTFINDTEVHITQKNPDEYDIDPSLLVSEKVYQVTIAGTSPVGSSSRQQTLAATSSVNNDLIEYPGVTFKVSSLPNQDILQQKYIITRFGKIEILSEDFNDITPITMDDFTINLQPIYDLANSTCSSVDHLFPFQNNPVINYAVIDITKFKEWKNSARLNSFKLLAPGGQREFDMDELGQRIPIILLHGINLDENKSKSCPNGLYGDVWCADYKYTVWKTFYERALSKDPEFFSKFKVYEYIYPSYQDFRTNGKKLADKIMEDEELKASSVYLIAHSMGGLVARAAMDEGTNGIGDRVEALFTLATPHHGSIGASLLWLEDDFLSCRNFNCDPIIQAFYNKTNQYRINFAQNLYYGPAIGTSGYKSLLWDNFDTGIPDHWQTNGQVKINNYTNKTFDENDQEVVIDLSGFNDADKYKHKIVTYSGGNLISALDVPCDGVSSCIGKYKQVFLRLIADSISSYGEHNDDNSSPNYLGEEGGDGVVERSSSKFMASSAEEGLTKDNIDHGQVYGDPDTDGSTTDFIDDIIEKVMNHYKPNYHSNPSDTTTTGITVAIPQIDTSGGADNIQMYATVVTQNGNPLENLAIGNFALDETVAGVTSRVAVNSLTTSAYSGKAISTAIVIDRSGSMGPSYNNDIVAAKAAAKSFVSNMSPQDKAAVIDFAGDVVVRQNFTSDKNLLNAAIDSVEVGFWNGTAIYDATYQACDLTAAQTGQKVVIVLTDGEDNVSSYSIDETISHALSLSTPVYTIGLGLTPGSYSEQSLINISNGTNAGSNGSGYYYAPASSSLKTLYDTISGVLSSAYIIGWSSSGSPGDEVTVNITVNYTSANGNFTDYFISSYIVPSQ
ncbi:hypothetical protein CO110_10210 [Candidatus Desantisbacteria bacterium CG_4_9_14_3_um_filter_40_11]|uniref:VWFA domain-containing protein n=1 Tax=Candidatus Desantisbacteria bacterium CG_4_9_14_3_um_filter_40_11 TaxID=1974546 RepID=A0A2M8AQX9_9BACT|nr:MAG: hypothetical protein CO110_10210 [Candidatus Desantisbacteria bacterium CG_4_9_14_3_um_filter_40_11]